MKCPHYEKKRKIPPDARTVKETTLLLSSLRNKESVISHPFYVSVMSLFGQSRDSLKEHIYPSFRSQTDKLKRETQCAHQSQKYTFTYKLREPLNHNQRVLALD